MFYMEIALTLIFGGALVSYLANDKQRLLDKPLSAPLAWGVLTISIIISSALLSQFYAPVTALIYSVGTLLFNWILIVLLAGHWPQKLQQVSLTGFIVAIFFAQFGGA